MKIVTRMAVRGDYRDENHRRQRTVALLGVSLGVFCAITASEIHARDTTPPAETNFIFDDDFERSNADSLGSDWLDCKQSIPDSYEGLGVYDGGVVINDPFTRPGTYGVPPLLHAPKEGELFPGIGCAYIDTGTGSVSVKILWSGNHGVEEGLPYEHVEATPLLYITPTNPRFGFGAWISELWGEPVVFAGYIASPPENFEVIATALMPEHESGTPRRVELRAEEPGKVTVWVDGEQLVFDPGGTAPLEVDPTMINSTLHGIAVDAHAVAPQSNIPTIKGIETVTIQSLD